MNRLQDYEQADDPSAADRLSDAVSENPGVALGFAAAAGVVAGLVVAGMFREVQRAPTASEKMQDFFAGVKQSVEDAVRNTISV